MKIKSIIHAQWDRYAKEWKYEIFNGDMKDYGYVPLKEVEIEFESPTEKELQRLTVSALRQKQATIRAKAHLEAQEVEEEIGELLALEDFSKREETDDEAQF